MAWKQKFSFMKKENGIKHLTIPSQTTIGLCELYKLKMTVVKWLDIYFQNFNLCDCVHCWKRIYHRWIYKWTTLPNKNHCRIQRWNMEGCGILSPWSYQSQCNHLRINYNGCWWFAPIWNSVSVDLYRESLHQLALGALLIMVFQHKNGAMEFWIFSKSGHRSNLIIQLQFPRLVSCWCWILQQELIILNKELHWR